MSLSIRHERMSGAFDKWHVEGLPFPAVFHRFTAPDTGEPHDHPWPFLSTILSGGYTEEAYDAASGDWSFVSREPGATFMVEAEHVHRIVKLGNGECWTLIQPLGPKVRESGFWRWRDGQPERRPWNGDWAPVDGPWSGTATTRYGREETV